MATSRSFGSKGAKRPNILINNGIGMEVRDLRKDVDEAFLSLEGALDTVAGASVLNLAALSALENTPGAPRVVKVASLQCDWQRTSNALTPDGITVIAATGGGVWERITATTSLVWLSQSTWYIDSAAVGDEGVGDAAHPLKTFEELSRRLSPGGLKQDTQVYLSPGTLVNDKFEVDTNDHLLTIEGVPTVVRTGAVDTYTDRTHTGAGGGEVSKLTDAGVADWTANVWQRVRITSGVANNAVAWVAGVSPGGAGLNVAATSRFGQVPTAPVFTPTIVSPAVGVSYVVEDLPRLQGFAIKQRPSRSFSVVANRTAIIVKNIAFGGASLSRLDLDLDSGFNIIFDGCSFDAYVQASSVNPLNFTRCRGGGTSNAAWGALGAQLNWRACCFVKRYIIQDAFNLNFSQSLCYGITEATGAVGQSSVTLGLRIEVKFSDCQISDCALGFNFILAGDVWVRNGFSGPRNTIGVMLGDGSDECLGDHHFFWSDSTDMPNLSGTTTPIRIRGDFDIDLAWSDMPFRSDEQRGKATLDTGGTVLVTARNALRRGVYYSRNTPGGTPGHLSVPDATRTNTNFVINSTDAADRSTVDWFIPGTARGDVMCEGSLNSA